MFGAMPQPGQPMPAAMPQPGQPMFGALPSPTVPAPVQGAPQPVPVANKMDANNYKAFIPSQAPATEGAQPQSGDPFAAMMGSFEQMAIQKKQAQEANQQYNQYDNGNDGYYDEQDDGQGYPLAQGDLIASLQQNPGMLTDALSKLSTNPELQQQLGGQNLDMLNNLAAQIELNGGLPGALGGYNPDIIGYNEYLGEDAQDDEDDDTVYLSMDQVVGSGPQSGYDPLQQQAAQ